MSNIREEKPLRESLLQGKRDTLMPNVKMHFYNEPPVFEYGDMQYLYGVDGKKYTDFFAGVSAMICGHSNPFIIEKTTEQLKKLQHKTIIYLDENIVKLAEKIAEIAPGNLDKTFFSCSGSESNDTALVIARRHTGKPKFINLENALHGRTQLSMAATTIPMWKSDPFAPDIFYTAKGFWRAGVDLETSARESIESIKEILENHNDIAALICEPIQGNGGVLTPPLWYFKEMKALLEQHGVLMIVDEVQTGIARTGEMFAINHYDVVPDFLVAAKGLSGGLAISTLTTTSEIADKSFKMPFASTFGGSPVTCANALAIIEYVEKENLIERSKTLGEYLKEQFLTIESEYISEVRGKGMMLGIELKGAEPNVRVDNILEEMKNRGFILGKCGVNRDTLMFHPPLVVTKEDIDAMVKELSEVINL